MSVRQTIWFPCAAMTSIRSQAFSNTNSRLGPKGRRSTMFKRGEPDAVELPPLAAFEVEHLPLRRRRPSERRASPARRIFRSALRERGCSARALQWMLRSSAQVQHSSRGARWNHS